MVCCEITGNAPALLYWGAGAESSQDGMGEGMFWEEPLYIGLKKIKLLPKIIWNAALINSELHMLFKGCEIVHRYTHGLFKIRKVKQS